MNIISQYSNKIAVTKNTTDELLIKIPFWVNGFNCFIWDLNSTNWVTASIHAMIYHNTSVQYYTIETEASNYILEVKSYPAVGSFQRFPLFQKQYLRFYIEANVSTDHEIEINIQFSGIL